jgi:hypothetical protein
MVEISQTERFQYGWSSAKRVKNRTFIEHLHIARYIRPETAEFWEERKTDNRPAIEKLWDDTPIKANDMFARGLWSMSHNSSTDWCSYQDRNALVRADEEATGWYVKVNADVRQELSDSGVYAGLLNRLKDVGAFGFGALYSYETDNQGHLAFEYVPAAETFYTVDRKGLCNGFHRPLNLTARQAIIERKWPKEKLSQSVRDAYDRKDEDTKFLFLHIVEERKHLDKRARPRSNKDFQWAGYYVETETWTLLDEHGFRDMPYHVMGWGGAPGTPYPNGIGFITLPEIRNLNAQRKKFDRILDNESDSPKLAPNQDEGANQYAFKPGETIYGGMTGDGKRLYEPYYAGGTGSRSLAVEIDQSRNLIREAWHYSLMVMQSNQQMTAEEVRSRDAKMIQAMGPFIVLMAADLRTIVDRVFYARLEAGAYDPLPAVFDAETQMELKFSGILAKAQMVLESESIVGLYAEASMIAQYDPDAVVHGLNHGEALRALGNARSVPAGIVKTAEAAKKSIDAAAQQKQQMMAAQMAPDMAKAAKDGAQAVATIGETGGGQGIRLAAG